MCVSGFGWRLLGSYKRKEAYWKFLAWFFLIGAMAIGSYLLGDSLHGVEGSLDKHGLVQFGFLIPNGFLAYLVGFLFQASFGFLVSGSGL